VCSIEDREKEKKRPQPQENSQTACALKKHSGAS
jgi:hypothetical protein